MYSLCNDDEFPEGGYFQASLRSHLSDLVFDTLKNGFDLPHPTRSLMGKEPAMERFRK